MSKKLLLVVGAVLAVVIAVIFWVWKKHNNDARQYGQVQQNQTQNEKIDIDTTNWKTYRNKEYGFEVKYPEEWEYDEIDGITFSDKEKCIKDYPDEYWCKERITFLGYEINNGAGNKFEGDIVYMPNIEGKVYRKIEKSNNKIINEKYTFITGNKNWFVIIKYTNTDIKKTMHTIINSFKMMP